GPWYGTASQIVFVLVGAAGVPVFTGFNGGIGILAGPRGGFILSYIVTALVAGLLIDRLGTKVWALLIAMAAGWVCTYGIGVPWIAWQTQTGLLPSLSAYCLPFLPGDAAKTALCVFMIVRLRPVLRGKADS
ncbi:MAG: biotin transporter BioY, partial [Oscillospiraceae bacterium]|nr:biotin transporter BioY [Oscillospiraceae bacterium]